MCSDLLAFAGNHPIVAVLITLCVVGNVTRLLVEIIKVFGR